MSARARSKVSGTASALAIGGSLLMATVCPPLGLGLLALSTVATVRARRNLRPLLEAEGRAEQQLLQSLAEANGDIAREWRQYRQPGEHFLRIDRVVEEEVAFGVTTRRIVDSEVFEA